MNATTTPGVRLAAIRALNDLLAERVGPAEENAIHAALAELYRAQDAATAATIGGVVWREIT